MQSAEHSTLLSQVQLSGKDVATFGRTILAAEQHCKSVGVTLKFASAQEFLEVNKSNRDTWLPVASLFNPEFCELTNDNSLFVIGYDAEQQPVACQACRLYDWTDTSFKEQCESLRMWYDDPAAMRQPHESATVTALSAAGTTGLVAYSGAAWYRPDYRKKGLVKYLPRLSRAYAAGVWRSEVTITLMTEQNVALGVFPRNGYANIEWGVDVMNNRSGTIRFAYIWSKQDEMVRDLRSFLDDLAQAARGDTGVRVG
jgi:hypothetical protein